MSQLFISTKRRNSGSAIEIRGHYYNNNDDNCFQEITQIQPITLKAIAGNQLLITLNIPDTWCDKAGDWGWFAVKVNEKIVTRGLQAAGSDAQRVPITLQTVVDVDSEKDFVIKAMWCNGGGTENRRCYIGEYSEAVLTVLLLD